MTGQQAGTLVGAVIGGAWGGSSGAQWGALIGGYVGGVISPTVIRGPSIGDAQQQTSLGGQPIPKFYGRPPPVAPTLVDGDKIARKVTRETSGKGATTVAENDGFIATRFFLVGESPNGEANILRIRRNGKLVFSQVAGDNIDAESGSFASQLTIYRGGPTQGPDPSLEAIHGVGNVCYYRNRLCFIVRDDDETQTAGAANQYMVEVASCGDITEGVAVSPLAAKAVMWLEMDDGSAEDGFFDSASPSEPASLESHAADPNQYIEFGTKLFKNGTNSVRFIDDGSIYPTCLRTPNAAMNASMEGQAFAYSIWFSVPQSETISRHCLLNRNAELSSSHTFIYVDNDTGAIEFVLNDSQGPPDNISFTSSRTELTGGSPHLMILRYDGAGTYYIYIDGTLDSTVSHPSSVGGGAPGSTSFIGAVQGGEVSDGYFEQAVWFIGDIGEDGADILWNNGDGTDFGPLWGGTQIPDSPDYYVRDGVIVGPGRDTIDACPVTWEEVVTDIAGRASPLLPDRLNIAHMTDVVPGFTLGNATLTATDYIRTLCMYYFVDGVDYDGKINFVRRGGPIVATFTDDDLLDVEEDDNDIRSPAVTGFKRLTVMYPDPANNYVPTPQTAPRTSPDVTATNQLTLQCPIPFSADVMAQKTDILQKIEFLQIEGGFKRALPAKFSKYVASDPISFGDRRFMIIKASNDDSMVTFEGIYDRPSAYESVAIGTVAPPPEPPTSSIKGPTEFAAMNLPRLRSEDSSPGMYLAVSGHLAGWPGADIYVSLDLGETYPFAKTITTGTPMGFLVGGIGTGSSGEPITVRMVGSGSLESVTDAQIAARANAFAILDTSNVAEIGQFKTATLESSGYYELTDVTRGELGTEEVDHLNGEQFVALANVVFLPIDVNYAGKIIKFKVVTRGSSVANGVVYSVRFLPQFTSPETIDFYTNELGEVYTNESGDYYRVTV